MSRLQLVPSDGALERTGDAALQLRKIAADIDSGALVGVLSAAVIVEQGTGLMIYGIADGAHAARLNAAYMLLNLALRELERVATEAKRG